MVNFHMHRKRFPFFLSSSIVYQCHNSSSQRNEATSPALNSVGRDRTCLSWSYAENVTNSQLNLEQKDVLGLKQTTVNDTQHTKIYCGARALLEKNLFDRQLPFHCNVDHKRYCLLALVRQI